MKRIVKISKKMFLNVKVYVDDDDEHRKADGDGVRRNNFVIFIAGWQFRRHCNFYSHVGREGG